MDLGGKFDKITVLKFTLLSPHGQATLGHLIGFCPGPVSPLRVLGLASGGFDAVVPRCLTPAEPQSP
ncbi:hypothetical protein JOF38_001770 [Paenarthrobacter nicotinovorans]|nr:hypothetical protein [Paenarthrobacter nicotinovorans]